VLQLHLAQISWNKFPPAAARHGVFGFWIDANEGLSGSHKVSSSRQRFGPLNLPTCRGVFACKALFAPRHAGHQIGALQHGRVSCSAHSDFQGSPIPCTDRVYQPGILVCLIDTWALFPTSVGYHPRGRAEDHDPAQRGHRNEITGNAGCSKKRRQARHMPSAAHAQLVLHPRKGPGNLGVIPVCSKTSANINHKALVPHLQQPVSASCAARRLAKSPGGGAQGISGCSRAWSGP
jgi:hypothetical protein